MQTNKSHSKRVWLLCALALIIGVGAIASVAYQVSLNTNSGSSVGSSVQVAPIAKDTIEPIEVTAEEELPTVLSQEERMQLHLKLSQAQAEAEAVHILSMHVDADAPDWTKWRQDVTRIQTLITEEQDRRMSTLLKPYKLSLSDADDIWAFTLREGRWQIPPSDPIDSIADWYYRRGLRFYFAGGVENFTQAYYEFAVATAFGHELSQQLSEKIAPLVPEEQRDHAVAFAINLQTLMMPEEVTEVLE